MSLFTNLLWEQREGKEETKRQGPGASCSDPSEGRLHAEAMEPGAFGELRATTCWISQGGCAGEESTSEHVSLLEGGRRGVRDLLWPQARGVGRPGRELAQVAWFPLSHGGLHSLIVPR